MDRRSLLTGGAALLVARSITSESHAQPSQTFPQDSEFMELAINQAKEGDAPFGALIARGDKVLALGRDNTKRSHDPTAHAEMMAIRAFLQGHEPTDFQGTTIYSSCEPCVMCMGAILWCGISRLVYAAPMEKVVTKIGWIEVPSRDVVGKASFAKIDVAGGLLAGNAMRLFE